MDNRQWLSDFWQYPDKMQGVLLQYISRLDTADSIQQVFDRFNKTAPALSIREVTRLHEHLQDDDFAEAQQLKRRRNINRNEAVVCYIIAELLGMYRLITAKAEQTFTEIATEKYGSTVPFSIKKLMNEPMTNGKTLPNELLGNARYRARQLTDYYTMQRNYDNPLSADDTQVASIIKADKNSLLRATQSGYTGLYDDLMTNIVGYTTLQSFIGRGVKNVEFVAVMDGRTTDRCAQLNGTRWDVSQLRLGYNVPPITEESIPHPCRSALRVVAFDKNVIERSGGADTHDIMSAAGESGAKKTWGWQDRHAQLMYEEIRKRTADVKQIAKNTGFTQKAVAEIKQHLFFAEHRFKDGTVSRFHPDFEQAQVWDRLTQGTHTQTDLVLLRHEYVELTQMKLHALPYEDAHEIANQLHNWAYLIRQE